MSPQNPKAGPTCDQPGETPDPSSQGADATRSLVRRRRKDARPGELTAAALELFVDKGFAATRLDDVAARAGVSKGTLYLYFESKEALFEAVVEEAIVPLLAAAEQHIADYRGDTVELLQSLIFGWWKQVGATRLAGVPKLLISEARNFPRLAQYYHDRVLLRGRSVLRMLLQRGIERGEFRPLDLDLAIDVVYAPLMMLVIWRSSMAFCAREIDPEAYLKTHCDLLVNGLRQKGNE